MGGASATVDVRDMLCAQALAVVAQAVGKLAHGQSLLARYSASDVKHDLLVWARDQGHRVHEPGAATLLIEKAT
jgi:TusA-related sulfurtransferase